MKRLLEFREVRHVTDLSDSLFQWDTKLEDGVFYIEDGSPYVGYNCPCGCGKVVMLLTKKNTSRIITAGISVRVAER